MTVRFMGDFELDKEIELGASLVQGIYGDKISVTDITFESYGKEKARIIGGKILKNFKKDAFNGRECISVYIPEVEKGDWDFTDLYVNGKPAVKARYPKHGALKAKSAEYTVNSWAKINNGSNWFCAYTEDLKDIEGIENGTISFYHFFIDEHSPVESYDKETGKITLKYYSRLLFSSDYSEYSLSGIRYFIEDVPSAFTDENEWYLDRKTGMLYYIPENGANIDNIEIIAPTVKHFAHVCGTKDNKAIGIRFRNLSFIGSKGDYVSTTQPLFTGMFNIDQVHKEYASDAQSWHGAYGAIRFENACTCAVENCDITCAGMYSVEINKGCSNIRVENCAITNGGAGGVKIFGSGVDEEDMRPTYGNTVRNNIISHCGKRYLAGCGVLVGHSSQNEISENEIGNLDYSGISVGWVWGYKDSSTYGNIIKNNHVHHIGQGRLSDMGAIYLLGRQHGTVVSGNTVHDVKSLCYGGWGIYTDEGSSFVTVENNTVYNCQDACYKHHFGMYNTVRNNVFATCGGPLIEITRREDRSSVLIEENIMISDCKNGIYCSGQGGFLGADINTSNNTYWNTSGGEPLMFRHRTGEIYLQKWQEVYGYDQESKVEKPSDEILKRVNL